MKISSIPNAKIETKTIMIMMMVLIWKTLIVAITQMLSEFKTQIEPIMVQIIRIIARPSNRTLKMRLIMPMA